MPLGWRSTKHFPRSPAVIFVSEALSPDFNTRVGESTETKGTGDVPAGDSPTPEEQKQASGAQRKPDESSWKGRMSLCVRTARTYK